MRKLTKQTIKPVLKFIGNWGGSIYSFNTPDARFYHFTLDTYNGKNSFTGGFDYWLDDALHYDAYAIELATGKVYNQQKDVVMVVNNER